MHYAGREGKSDSAGCPINALREGLGGAQEAIAHRMPFGSVGGHLDIDRARVLRVQLTQASVEALRVGCRIGIDIQDKRLAEIKLVSM